MRVDPLLQKLQCQPTQII